MSRRSREGAWIEMSVAADDRMDKGVAPARERGLKYSETIKAFIDAGSLPRGSVD